MKKIIYIALLTVSVGCEKQDVKPSTQVEPVEQTIPVEQIDSVEESVCYECITIKNMWTYGDMMVDTIRKTMCGFTPDDAINYEISETYVIERRYMTMYSLFTKCNKL